MSHVSNVLENESSLNLSILCLTPFIDLNLVRDYLPKWNQSTFDVVLSLDPIVLSIGSYCLVCLFNAEVGSSSHKNCPDPRRKQTAPSDSTQIIRPIVSLTRGSK